MISFTIPASGVNESRIAEIRDAQPDLLVGWEKIATAVFRIYFWIVRK